MNELSINEYLNVNNVWSKRLLGLTDFSKKRDVVQIEREYNVDKYGSLLQFDFKTAEEYKSKEFELAGLHPVTGEMIISLGDAIFKTTVADARRQYYDLISSVVKKYNSAHLCELGCGYGYNLTRLDNKKTYGGEYSKNAVSIGKKLGLDVHEFNFYKEDDYNFITPETTILTTHSVEQIPDATTIVQHLEKHRHNINYVIHFEPTVVEERTSFLGLMRNKYMELNDYNRNLIPVLKGNPNVEIIELKTDLFGLVPLNTTNLIVWKFKK